MYIEEGRLHFHYNGYGDATDLPSVALPPGDQEVTLDYEAIRGREGRARLLIDDREVVGWTPMSPTMVLYGIFEGLDVGLDRRGPVLWPLYERHGSFPYTGEIRDVTVTPGTPVD